MTGKHLEGQTDYELVLNWKGEEMELADIKWSGNRYAKRPPAVLFGTDDRIYYSDYVKDVLTIKSITLDGLDEKELYKFSNATRAVISPDMKWIAFREYHRSFVTPFEYAGNTLTVSASDKKGFTQRVDQKNDGDFMSWSNDGKTLSWTRGRHHYEKSLFDILNGNKKLSKTDLAFTYKIAKPKSDIALTNVRVLTMNKNRVVLDNATILIRADEIVDVGRDVNIPRGTKVFDLEGRTVMLGMFDAHGHYGSPISPLNVIEQNLYCLLYTSPSPRDGLLCRMPSSA